MNIQQYEDMAFDDYDRRMAEVEAQAEQREEEVRDLLNDPDRLSDELEKDPRWVNNIAAVLVHWIATGDPDARDDIRETLFNLLMDE